MDTCLKLTKTVNIPLTRTLKGKESVYKVKETRKEVPKKSRRATTPEGREDQLISLAIDLAEEQLRNGTASSQVITHYLKLGSTKERLEKEILEEQKELMKAKTETLKSAKKVEELYADAITAMRSYSGSNETEEEDDE